MKLQGTLWLFCLLLPAFYSCQKPKNQATDKLNRTGGPEARRNAVPPNIILIMADDLGWGDTGYNGHPIIQTPHLDQMAKEGIQFNRFYSASAVCSPTRASVLTGRNPYRMGVFHANQGILRPEETTLPELLKAEGYTAGHFGKWHLGTLTHAEEDANRGKPGNLREYNPPAQHGYDRAFVTESKVPTYDPMKDPARKHDHVGWDYIKDGEAYTPYGTYYWDIDGNKVTDNLDGDDSRVIMDRVLPFVEKASSEANPFLAVVWFHAPHMPFVAGPTYAAKYQDQSPLMQNYAGCITALDEQVGRLRAFLKQKGVDKNTMIWFCSDNGPENGSAGSAGPFRDRKRSLHEGGVRVPGLLVWPARIPKGFVSDVPCVTSDYLPTIAEILNIPKNNIPNQLDGISLLPLIEGRMKERPVPISFLIENQASYTDNRYKLYARNGKFEMYDLIEDPSEKAPLQFSSSKIPPKQEEALRKFLASCRRSFEGEEYGKASYQKLAQKWQSPLK